MKDLELSSGRSRKGERQILQFLIRKLADKHFEDTLRFEIHK